MPRGRPAEGRRGHRAARRARPHGEESRRVVDESRWPRAASYAARGLLKFLGNRWRHYGDKRRSGAPSGDQIAEREDPPTVEVVVALELACQLKKVLKQ